VEKCVTEWLCGFSQAFVSKVATGACLLAQWKQALAWLRIATGCVLVSFCAVDSSFELCTH
jgi:hypothetical protein